MTTHATQKNKRRWVLAGVIAAMFILPAAIATQVKGQDTIGSVETSKNLLGSNDSIQIQRFDDPYLDGASCYLSYAKTGGLVGDIGFAEDRSRFSIACRKVGDIKMKSTYKNTQEVFKRSSSPFFKAMRVVRFHDKEKQAFVYLVYSRKAIDGSPYNSISVVKY